MTNQLIFHLKTLEKHCTNLIKPICALKVEKYWLKTKTPNQDHKNFQTPYQTLNLLFPAIWGLKTTSIKYFLSNAWQMQLFDTKLVYLIIRITATKYFLYCYFFASHSIIHELKNNKNLVLGSKWKLQEFRIKYILYLSYISVIYLLILYIYQNFKTNFIQLS